MSPTAKAFVDGLIASKPVVCFSKTYCPYCVKAKTVLDGAVKGGRGGYVVVELDERSDGGEIQAYLGQLTGASTVPRVFIGGSCIGGGDDTAAKQRSGELAKLLAAVGAAA